MQKTLPFLQPLPQGLHETFVPLAAFQLRGRLRIGRQRRCDGQPEADEQRQGLDRNSEIAFEPLDLPRQPIESGDRKDATAASTIAERDSFLRSARSAICLNSSGGK